MAFGEHDRNRTNNTGMSTTGIIMGLVVAALIIGAIAFTFTDRTPSSSTVTSPPTVTAPVTQPKTSPPSDTTTTVPRTPAPTPSTK